MRNVVAFDHQISRNQAKDICARLGISIHTLDSEGRITLGVGRFLVVQHRSRNRSYWYVDENSHEGLLEVRNMPKEVQHAAIGRMCDQLGMTQQEVLDLLNEQKDREFGQAILHALAVG